MRAAEYRGVPSLPEACPRQEGVRSRSQRQSVLLQKKPKQSLGIQQIQEKKKSLQMEGK